MLTIDLVGLVPNEDAIAALVNAGGGAWTGILRANSGGGPAFGTFPQTNLDGGVGDGFELTVAGQAAAPTGESGGLATSTASISDTQALMTTPNLGGAGLGAGDVAQVTIESDNYRSQSMSLVLA